MPIKGKGKNFTAAAKGNTAAALMGLFESVVQIQVAWDWYGLPVNGMRFQHKWNHVETQVQGPPFTPCLPTHSRITCHLSSPCLRMSSATATLSPLRACSDLGCQCMSVHQPKGHLGLCPQNHSFYSCIVVGLLLEHICNHCITCSRALCMFRRKQFCSTDFHPSKGKARCDTEDS